MKKFILIIAVCVVALSDSAQRRVWDEESIVWQRLDKAGTVFVVRAGEAHFEGSDGECLIIGTALGGWKTKE